MKMTERTEMARSTCLFKEGTITTFIKDWKTFQEFLLKMDKTELMILGFTD